MKMKSLLATLLVVPLLAISAGAQARTSENNTPPAYQTGGREVAAPPWSFACTTDQGPSQCGEPMWVYGSRAATARYGNPF